MEWVMVPNPWYIGNNAQNQKKSSEQMNSPFGLENPNQISKEDKVGMSKSQKSNPLQHLEKLLDLVKRSSRSDCNANSEYLSILHFILVLIP